MVGTEEQMTAGNVLQGGYAVAAVAAVAAGKEKVMAVLKMLEAIKRGSMEAEVLHLRGTACTHSCLHLERMGQAAAGAL